MKGSLIWIGCIAVLCTSCGKAKRVLSDIMSDDSKDKIEVVHDTIVKVVYPEEEQNVTRANSEPHRSKRLNVTGASYEWTLAPQGGNSYYPRNMFDGNRNTAWAASIGKMPVDADCYYGPTFNITADRIDRIVLTNGYAKSNKAFRDNARASYIIIARFDYENDDYIDERNILYSGPLKDTSSPQTLPISPSYRHVKGKQKYQICFSPGSFYHGDRWDDLCISEIEFYGIDSK